MPQTPRRQRAARRGRAGRTPTQRFFDDPRQPDAVVDENASCIDLTSTEDEQYVDLTSSQSLDVVEPVDVDEAAGGGGANDESIVIIGTPYASPRRGGRRQPSLELVERFELPPVAAPVRRFRLPPLGNLDNNDDDDLPPVPFEVATPASGSQTSGQNLFLSPEPIKITCPVCLEDDKSIKRMKKSLASTICGHVFCDECIHSAVRSQQCCPVCRQKLTHKNVHKLHI